MTLHWCVGFEVITIQLHSSLHLGLCNFLCWFSGLYFVVCIMKNIKILMGLCNFLCWFSELYFVVCIRKALGTQFHLVFGFLHSIVWLSFVTIFCHLVWLYVVLCDSFFSFFSFKKIVSHWISINWFITNTYIMGPTWILCCCCYLIIKMLFLIPPLDLLGEVHVAFLDLKLAVHHHFVFFFFGHLF